MATNATANQDEAATGAKAEMLVFQDEAAKEETAA
jgi:hypothetical protein